MKLISDLNSNGKKLRDYETSDLIKLSQAINGLAYKFNITKQMDPRDCLMLAEDLETSFSDFTFEEIEHVAFLYRNHELEYEEKHFQQLTTRFLAGALVCYRIKRNKALSKIQKDKEKQERDEANKDLREKTLPASYILMRSKVGTAYNKALESGKRVNIPESCASLFFRHLMLRRLLSLSKEVIYEYRQLGYEDLLKSFKSNEKLSVTYSKMVNDKTIYDKQELDFQELIKNRTAKIFIDDWLTVKSKTNIKFSEFFKENIDGSENN